jgi:hypothetical protein
LFALRDGGRQIGVLVSRVNGIQAVPDGAYNAFIIMTIRKKCLIR